MNMETSHFLKSEDEVAHPPQIMPVWLRSLFPRPVADVQSLTDRNTRGQ